MNDLYCFAEQIIVSMFLLLKSVVRCLCEPGSRDPNSALKVESFPNLTVPSYRYAPVPQHDRRLRLTTIFFEFVDLFHYFREKQPQTTPYNRLEKAQLLSAILFTTDWILLLFHNNVTRSIFRRKAMPRS